MIQRKRKGRQVFEACQRVKTIMQFESEGYTNCNLYAGNDPKSIDKEAGRVEYWSMNRYYLNYSIFKFSQNTRRLAVT